MPILMNGFSIFSIVAVALFPALSGCGPAPSSNVAPLPSGDLQASGLQQSFELAREAEVTCAEGTECPENVGMLVSANEEAVTRCTGSLIAPDLVLTASRCVPPALRDETLSCAERIRFMLPAVSARPSPLPARQSRCARVLETGPIHALIRLESPVSDRAPLKLDFTGVKDNLWVRIAAISPISGSKPFGELRVVRCAARQRTVAYPRFRTDKSPVVSLSGCGMTEAGAGAPVLNGVGAVRAIIGDALGSQASREIQERYSAMLGDTPVTDLVEAANLTCIRFPATFGIGQNPLPAVCTAPEARDSQHPDSSLIPLETMSAARAELEQRLSGWQSAESLKLGWRLPALTQSSVQDVQPLPSCIAQSDQWLGAYKHWYRRGGYDSKAEIKLKVPHYRLSFAMNSSYQLQYSLKALSPVSMTLRFDPGQLVLEKRTSVHWGSSGSAVLYPCS